MKVLKLNKLNTALATLGLLAASQAHAYGPTVTPDYIIYLTGGAEQNEVFQYVSESLFQTDGNLHIYTDQTNGSDGKAFRALFGTWKTTTSNGKIPAGSKVELIYYTTGGAYNAVGPLSNGTALPYVTLVGNATSTGVAQGTFTAGEPTLAPNYAFTSLTLTTLQVPNVGLSNEEPELYTGVNVPTGKLPPKFSQLKSITPLYQVVNGIVVTQNLYAQKPNWSKAEIAAIWLGNAQDWSFFKDANGNPLPAGPIYVADRNAGSGAKAAFNEYFLNNTSGVAAGGALNQTGYTSNYGLDPTWTFGSPTYTFAQFDSAGKVYPALNLANSAGQRAIGILGGEYVPGTASDDLVASGKGGWRHISIDGRSIATDGTVGSPGYPGGQAYTTVDAVSGAYDYVYQASLQTTTFASALVNDFFTSFAAAAGNPALLQNVPGVLLDPATVTFSFPGSPYDSIIAHGTRFANSAQPVQLEW